MALVNKLVNRKVRVKSKKLSRVLNASRYDNKYYENKDKLLKSISYKRDLNRNSFIQI
jgi:hypothetical protein